MVKTGIKRMEGVGRQARLLLTGLMLLALLFQSYAAQTHIHPLEGIPGLTSLHLAPDAPTKNSPSDSDDCALCQMAHGGQTIVPDVPLLLLPMLAAYAALRLDHRLPRSRVVSHDWHGRGPPRF